ncbi:nuclear receptor-interacting protein 1-like [Coregonus clupeaformis]|uniref:nuclear receptor-interacting protein 1-like n=1 Tax=Coregonus clupeaformis TaxID=59861 RepID=UPI001E1C41B9|nr:nuclear receptor-interacting protein 1-like [Coregonus clupeaformis]XP_045080237.1 nuclear receptor-interacting protein 1-like [Coregonus clupeaformis]
MTHGEEPGPETHTDSAVLTYLEGLLMHPVASGPGATATRRSEAAHGHGNQVEQVNKTARPFQLPSHGPAIVAVQKAGNGPALHHGASQNLKKARLLRSGSWNEPGAQRLSSPPVEMPSQGGGGGLQNGALEGSPHAGESTLLASLLQSFSSRLQNVAMSQQSTKPPSERSPPTEPPPAADKERLPCYGMASSRLKGLMRKSKLQNHSTTPYSRRGHGHSQDRPSESPCLVQSSTPPSAPTTAAAATDAQSCAERLKAVANLVKIRSSPAPSPKPSVACSQLALLLSSEAHLQQYSREHALKIQHSGHTASERLAAMATQQTQDKRPPSAGEAPPTSTTTVAPDALSSLTAQNRTATTTLPRLALNSSSRQRSPSSLLPAHSSPRPTPPPLPLTPHTQTQPQTLTREKRGFDSRPARPPQTCSSLLLLLLNNHNNQKQLTKNGHLEGDCGVLPPSRGSSVTSDSECSVQEKSLAKREESCSDAESSYSSCSPIDLSMRSRANTRAPETRPKATSPFTSASYSSTAFSSSSSSAVFSSAPTVFTSSSTVLSSSSTAFSSSSTILSSSSTAFSSSSSSSLDKLTESLLNKWKPDTSGLKVPQVKKELEMSPDLKSHPRVTLMQLLLERKNNDKVNKIVVNPDLQHDATLSSLSRGPLKSLAPWEEVRTQSPLDRSGTGLPLYSLSRDPSSTPSPFSYPSPHVQSSPLDLCKSKPFPAEKAADEPAFSASKLLQNLAQCGTASPSPPMAPSKVPSRELEVGGGRPLALLERLNAPIQRNKTTTPLSDRPSGSGTPSFGRRGKVSPTSSQIENLLERRTVLQLLLGAGSCSASSVASATHRDRDRSGGRCSVETAVGSCYEKPPGTSVICDSSSGPSAADFKVKTEPGEEGLLSSAVCQDVTSRKRRGGGGRGGGGGGGYDDRHSPLSEPQQDLKTEPRPTEVIAKYGLLSQLLKQQSATYYTSATQPHTDRRPSPVPVKEEQRDYHHKGPSPKKRRLCSELAESLNNGSPQRAMVDIGSSHSHSSLVQSLVHSQIQEEPDYHRGFRSPNEEEAPARSPSSESLLPRESRGFNVLKQLLLSDNCLKELSQQPRGVHSLSVLHTNGKANGSILNLNQPGYNHHDLLNLPTLPWHHPHSSLNSGPPSHLRPLPTPPTGDISQSTPWGRHTAPPPRQDSPKREPTTVKQEPESPVRWAGRDQEEEEGCDLSPDSPRLTRSNPILYYMLQKGTAQLRREGRDQAEGTQGSGPGGVRVKEEPGNDGHDAYEHRLSSATTTQHSSLSPPYNNNKHSHKN